MKYLIVRCEDHAPNDDRIAPLLEGARASYLQELAQAGAAGRILPRQPAGLDRFQVHRAMFGLAADDPTALPGPCYAAAAKQSLKADETAWCCELVTQHDGVIVDATAGRIRTKESHLLLQGLAERFDSPSRRWIAGQDSHHGLVASDLPSAAGSMRAPELLMGQPWAQHLAKGSAGDALRSAIGEAAELLEAHPINRVRLDLGENPANLAWLWGPGAGGAQQSFQARTGLSASIVSSHFALRGLARALDLGWTEGPASFEEPAVQQLAHKLPGLLQRHDVVYVHFDITSADPVERLCAIERIDQMLLRPSTDTLSRQGPWRLLVAVDDRRHRMAPFVAIGSGLSQQPVERLDAERTQDSPLSFEDGAGLFAWLTADTAPRPRG